MMDPDIGKGDTLWFDSLFFLGTVLVAFGLGMRWDVYMRKNPVAILFYAAMLFLVYIYWVARPHKKA